MRKRWIAVFLVTALCLSLLPTLTVAAAEEDEPIIGLYSQPIIAPEYDLGDELIYTGESLVFYVLCSNMSVNGIGGLNGVDLCGEPEEFEIYNENDELVGFKLIAEDAQPGTYSFELRIPGEWVPVEFSIVDPRPMFRCRALRYNGVGYTVDENDILRTIVSGAAGETVGYVFYEIRNNQETELTLDDLSFPAHVTASALNADETWIALTFAAGNGVVSYTADDAELTLPVVVSGSDSSDWGDTEVQTFEFDGKTYKIGLAGTGFQYEDIPQIGLHDEHQTVTASSQDEISWDDYVMAVMDEDGNFVEGLSCNIEITDVSVTEFYSLGGTCSVAIAPENVEYYGAPLQTVRLTMQGAFVAEISVRYELNVATPNGPLEVSGVADFRYRCLPMGVYDLDLSAADTAEELNALFSSPKALVSWMENNAPEEYKAYKFLESMGDDMSMSHFNIYLPATTYDDIIIVQLQKLMVNIYGATDRNGNLLTTMPGLHLKDKSPACNLIGIHFKHDPEKELVYEGQSCGVLACGDEENIGDGNAIENCIMEGFGCAVRNTPYGHIGLGMNNLIRDCTYGLYMDCAGKTRGSVYTDISHSTFANCDNGIYIKSLPDYMDSFEYRVYLCDFIDVDTDFTVLEKGNFYFYRNFYGSLKSGKTLEEAQNATDILSRVPVVVLPEGGETNVVTNPRYILSYVWLNFTDDNFLSVDSTRETIILNAEADELVMDTEELAKEASDAGKTIVIGVADDNEMVQATWTIN